MVPDLRDAGLGVLGPRLDNLFSNILADVAQGGPRYGFTNATIPCFAAPVPCSTSVFADDLHPTAAAHQLISNAIYNRVVNNIDVSVVPEPASVLLHRTRKREDPHRPAVRPGSANLYSNAVSGSCRP